jgi:Flp pilus assembly protein TadG
VTGLDFLGGGMTRKEKGKLRGENGQAAIEFIAIIVVVFFFLLFFLSLTILLTVSDYLDYATFMAARTYKTGSSSENQQQINANIVWQSYTDKVYPEIIKSRALDFRAVDEANVRTAGVLTSYTIDLFYLPPLFAGANSPPSRITLNSETHLGRDPSFEECEGFFTDFASSLGVSDENLIGQMEDNGC